MGCATAVQIARRFGMSYSRASRRLYQLGNAGLVRLERLFFGRPGAYLATADGLAVAGVDLPPAEIDVRVLRRQLGAVELAIDAELAGQAVITARQMRYGDDAAYAIEVGGDVGRHIPDLVVQRDTGQWAIELELTETRRERLESVLRAYENAPQFAGVVMYAAGAARDQVAQLAEQHDLGERLELRAWDPPDPSPPTTTTSASPSG